MKTFEIYWCFKMLLRNYDEMKGESHVSKELDEQTGNYH